MTSLSQRVLLSLEVLLGPSDCSIIAVHSLHDARFRVALAPVVA